MKLLTHSRLRKTLKKVAAPQTGWLDVFPAIMGKADGTVLTSTNGIVWVRNLLNGQELTVYNAIVPNVHRLQVEVGRRVDQPGLWQIKGTLETFAVPAISNSESTVKDHHEQHEFSHQDTVWSNRKQVLANTVLVSNAAGFIVQVIGSVIHTASGIRQIDNQLVDLSSYVVNAGAKFVSIEADDEGVLSVHEGDVFEAPAVATYADVPVPDPGKYLVAFVLLYEGQTELSNNDIRVHFPLGVVAKATGLQIHEADEDTPLDDDEFAFWDVVDEVIKKITWANLVAALTAIFDLLYAAINHTHDIFNDDEGDPADVTTETADDGDSEFAARRNHVHHFESSGGAHLHGLTRWNGASGQTTFDLPDVWEYVDSVMLNGLEEDPLVYSLSSDRTQIVLDTALSAAMTVTARGVIATV